MTKVVSLEPPPPVNVGTNFMISKNYLFFQTIEAYAKALTVAVQFSLEVSASYTSRMIIASPADCRSIYENLGGQNVRISDKVCI